MNCKVMPLKRFIDQTCVTISDKDKDITAFINLSGGIDSTYYLWRYLSENKGSKNKILVHHCLFLKKRLKEEKNACDNIINYFKQQGFKNFEYIETQMDKVSFKKKTLDIEMIVGMASVIVKEYKHIKTVLLPYCKDETKDLNDWYSQGNTIYNFNPKHRYRKVNEIMELMSGRKFDYTMYKDDSDNGIVGKKQMLEEMPIELSKLCWYCRRPVVKSKGESIPCNKCHCCKKVNRTKTL